MATNAEHLVVINELISTQRNRSINPDRIVIGTHSESKLNEFRRLMPGFTVEGRNLGIKEIQDEDPLEVLRLKAIAAWEKSTKDKPGGVPVIVEDSSLSLTGIDNMVGPFADQMTNTSAKRQFIINGLKGQDRSAVFQVGLAVYDGHEVHYRIGKITGQIAKKPRGTNGFGFDPIFIPDNQIDAQGNAIPDGEGKTYAEMSDQEKDLYSARRLAVEAMLADPFDIHTPIFMLQEPDIQDGHIRVENLNDDERALKHAFNLEALAGNEVNANFEITNFPAYHEVIYGHGEKSLIKRYIVDPNSPSLGLIITPMDIRQDVRGHDLRLKTDGHGNVVFWQMGFESAKMALAARAEEFKAHHNEEMYARIREMKQALKEGRSTTFKRSHQRSPVIEQLIQIAYGLDKRMDEEEAWEKIGVYATAAFNELGYARQSSDRKLSRTKASQNLLLDSTGIPSSFFSLGGMPPVTGWKDVLVTSALSYMRSWIPRNSMYANDVDLQIRLFQAAREDIRALNLPEDIEDVCIRQIGVSIGSENPEKILEDVKRMKQAGINSIRIYTTNPDMRTVQTAQLIHDTIPDMTICVGPVVDIKQAKELAKAGVKIMYAGHGGGENCTSLAGGGAANSLELAYLMSIDSDFDDVAIGFEGGTGDAVGAILGMGIDVVSLSRRGVAGGIELGGLFVEHSDGNIVQPYSGSASPNTQWQEIVFHTEELSLRRLDDAARLENVEGVIGYSKKERHINSITDRWHDARMLAGRALADQDSQSINELREHIAQNGHFADRIITGSAGAIAQQHSYATRNGHN